MNYSLITNLSLIVALGASQASLAQSSVAQDRQQAAQLALKNSGKGPLEMGMDWLNSMLKASTATIQKHASLPQQWKKWESDYDAADRNLNSAYRALGGEEMVDDYQRAISSGVRVVPEAKKVTESIVASRKNLDDVKSRFYTLQGKGFELATATVQGNIVKSALAATQGAIKEVDKVKTSSALAQYDAALKTLDDALLKNPTKMMSEVNGNFMGQKIDNLSVKQERLERLYDRAIIGNYVQAKMEDLLTSRQFCLAAQTCVQTGKPQKVAPLNSLFVHPEEKSDAPAEKKSH